LQFDESGQFIGKIGDVKDAWREFSDAMPDATGKFDDLFKNFASKIPGMVDEFGNLTQKGERLKESLRGVGIAEGEAAM